MAKVQQDAHARLAEERWEFFEQLWRATRSAGQRTVALSIQGSVEARVAACRADGGESMVPACPGCGSIERRDFRKNGSYERQLLTSEGPIRVRVPRLRCRCGKSIPVEQLGYGRRRRVSYDLLTVVIELVGMRTALRSVVAWLERRGIHLSAASLSRMLARLELPVLGPLEASPAEMSVDAMYVKLWDKERPPGWDSERAAVLLAVNHDPRVREKVIGMVFAPAETEEGYRSLADQLISRGMDPHAPLVVVSDGAQVIPAGFSRSFTDVSFQRCQWHLAREVREAAPVALKERAAGAAWYVLQARTPAEAAERLQQVRTWRDSHAEALALLERGLEAATLCLRRPVIQRTNGRAERYVRELRRHYRPREAFRSNRCAVRRIAFWTPTINARHTGIDWLASLLAAQLGLRRRISRFPAPVHT
ncbi:MAG TPA: transposase [Dehalococcoidia bacterium]|nr:transposase [Dehalococcoidia bacterium]